jgi:flagellar basal-body rod protein FlgF
VIYGLYLSAAGVMTNAYRQDVISNNLANVETVGFRRDVATFRQRLTAAQMNPSDAQHTDSLLEQIGGGTFADPTGIDMSSGDLETTGGDMDAAIVGRGFFTVAGADGQPRLTRDGRFQMDRAGHMTLSNSEASPVLDSGGNKILLDPTEPVFIDSTGKVQQPGRRPIQIGLADVADPRALRKDGDSLLSATDPTAIAPYAATVVKGTLERSNVDPATELSALMETQRQLQANANMIETQDGMLDKLVNDAGKIS